MEAPLSRQGVPLFTKAQCGDQRLLSASENLTARLKRSRFKGSAKEAQPLIASIGLERWPVSNVWISESPNRGTGNPSFT